MYHVSYSFELVNVTLELDNLITSDYLLLDMDVPCSPHCPRQSSLPGLDHLQSRGRHYRPSHLGLLQLSKRKQVDEIKAFSVL